MFHQNKMEPVGAEMEPADHKSNGETTTMLNGTVPISPNGKMTETVTQPPETEEDLISSGGSYKRETWSRKIDFLLACIGFSVGLGNVWRFPYLCYKNGGGAFLIPYFICVVLGGIPMFFLEVALGQFMTAGGISVWNICPLFKGIGYATTIIVFFLNCYYNVILAWAFYFLFSSFTKVLPWSMCDNEWNTDKCIRSLRDHNNTTSTNGTDVFPTGGYNDTGGAVVDRGPFNITAGTYADPATEFWERKVLQISSGIEDVGTIKWDLALCLLLAWVVVYFCIWKGIKSSGKVKRLD